MVFAVPFLDKLKIDDVVGAIPVHLIAGFWGTLVVPVYTDGTSFVTQIIGFASIGAFVFIVSLIVWMILKATTGIRVSEEAEIAGLDVSELGLTNLAAVTAISFETTDGVTMVIDADTTVTLEGVSLSDLSIADFDFA